MWELMVGLIVTSGKETFRNYGCLVKKPSTAFNFFHFDPLTTVNGGQWWMGEQSSTLRNLWLVFVAFVVVNQLPVLPILRLMCKSWDIGSNIKSDWAQILGSQMRHVEKESLHDREQSDILVLYYKWRGRVKSTNCLMKSWCPLGRTGHRLSLAITSLCHRCGVFLRVTTSQCARFLIDQGHFQLEADRELKL